MKKLIISCGLVTMIGLIGCGPSHEERAKTCNCEESSQKYWYNQGATMGTIASIADDGKRDYNWAKNQAIENGGEMMGFPSDEKKFGDCWYKGFLDSYDKK